MSATVEHECYVFSGTSGVIHLTKRDVDFRDVGTVEIRIVVAFLRPSAAICLHPDLSSADGNEKSDTLYILSVIWTKELLINKNHDQAQIYLLCNRKLRTALLHP